MGRDPGHCAPPRLSGFLGCGTMGPVLPLGDLGPTSGVRSWACTPGGSSLVGLSPICKMFLLMGLQQNLPYFSRSFVLMKDNTGSRTLVFKPSAHLYRGQHVLVSLNRGDAKEINCLLSN